MIHKDDAARINREVRDFYTNGVKSNNKVYTTGADPNMYVDFDDPFDGYWQNWSNHMLAQKAWRRNYNADLASAHRPSRTSAESYYDFGKRIYNGGKRAEFTSGNCMEMAAVSAVIAIDDYHFAPDWLYIVEVGAPGDHAYCLLSMRKPTWSTPSNMVPGSGPAGYVIDPWLNTVCEADDYWSAVKFRVNKWAQAGKRIAWGGLNGNNFGWYCPNTLYATAFGASPLDFVPVMAP
jgi:hypothetical protein